MKMTAKCHLYTRTLRGHRGTYLTFAMAQLEGDRIEAADIVIAEEPVLCLMVEEGFFSYTTRAIRRAIHGRRTIGLLFRPGPAVTANTKNLWLKKQILQFLKRIPQVQTLSIVPVPLKPEFGEIVDGWIHDFQLWDMSAEGRKMFDDLQAENLPQDHPAALFYAQIKQEAQGRPVLVSLGMQSKGKGYSILSEALPDLAKADWFVVAAGKVAEDQKSKTPVFSEHGMMSVDRFLDDSEILAAYAAADTVWCLYDPSYDQASGILGRAVQFGVPPLVREGSFSEAFCKSENIAHVVAEGAVSVPQALEHRPDRSPEAGKRLAERLRSENLDRLNQALWGKAFSNHA